MRLNVAPDNEKAKALVTIAKITLERLHESNVKKYPSNALIDYYDSIHKFLDAITCIEGIKIRGDGAHQQLIEYVCTEHLSDKEKIFLQDMREYRNRIYYEGFIIDFEYITSNSAYIEKIIKILTTTIERKIKGQNEKID